MKRWIALLLCLAMVGCQPAAKAEEIVSEEPQTIEMGTEEYQEMWNSRDENPEIFKPIWNLAVKSTPMLLDDEKPNLSYSPLSLYSALSLLQAGAEGETREQLLELLSQESPEDISVMTQKVWDWIRMESPDEDAVIRMANSVWVTDQKEWNPAQEFIHAITDEYYASMHQAKFGSKETDERINGWIKEKTDDHLDLDFETDADTVMMLINALYYRAHWLETCEEELVEDLPFTLASGEKIDVPTMRFEKAGPWSQGEGYVYVDKPLQRGKMRFILPDEGMTPKDLMEREDFFTMLTEDKAEYTPTKLYLPKFDIESELALNDILQDLGMRRAFQTDAEFLPMGLGDIMVSLVQQNTRMTVNEDGVEASAATIIAIEESGFFEPEEPKEIHLDRPFIFVLSYADMPLFIGVCGNPIEK